MISHQCTWSWIQIFCFFSELYFAKMNTKTRKWQIGHNFRNIWGWQGENLYTNSSPSETSELLPFSDSQITCLFGSSFTWSVNSLVLDLFNIDLLSHKMVKSLTVLFEWKNPCSQVWEMSQPFGLDFNWGSYLVTIPVLPDGVNGQGLRLCLQVSDDVLHITNIHHTRLKSWTVHQTASSKCWNIT